MTNADERERNERESPEEPDDISTPDTDQVLDASDTDAWAAAMAAAEQTAREEAEEREEASAAEHEPVEDEEETTDAAEQPEDALAEEPTSSKKKRRRRRRRKRDFPGASQPGTTVSFSGPRHQARILAMQSLYEHDLTEREMETILTRIAEDEDEPTPEPIQDHVQRLTRGVLADLETIDSYIGDAAPAFPIAQIAMIDRAVLRLAVFELLHEQNVPFKAVINEAVEIAKRFGGPSSGRFVNGVLGTIVNRIPRQTSMTG